MTAPSPQTVLLSTACRPSWLRFPPAGTIVGAPTITRNEVVGDLVLDVPLTVHGYTPGSTYFATFGPDSQRGYGQVLDDSQELLHYNILETSRNYILTSAVPFRSLSNFVTVFVIPPTGELCAALVTLPP